MEAPRDFDSDTTILELTSSLSYLELLLHEFGHALVRLDTLTTILRGSANYGTRL